jgi:tetratricopeptide (TPR) repeat protein
MNAFIRRLYLVAFLISLPALSVASAQEEYKRFSDAISAGNKLLREKQYAAAQVPLEAALKLADSEPAEREQRKLRTYEMLVPCYRQLPEIDKMLEAHEYIIPHTDRRAGRMNAARDLASFLHQRGKIKEAIARYDGKLQKDPKDITALSVLAIIYTRVDRNEELGLKYTQRVEDANREIASRYAEKLEKDAAAAPQTAAFTLKDAAAAWLEAGDKPKALAAAKKSAASPPEARNDLLVYYWRDGLGDVFLGVGEPALAIPQFEAALAATSIAGHKQATEKKLAEAKAAPKP